MGKLETLVKNTAVFTLVGEMLVFLLPDPSYEKYYRFLLNMFLLLFVLKTLLN